MGIRVSRRRFFGTTAFLSLSAAIPWASPPAAAAAGRLVPDRGGLTSCDGWLMTTEDKRTLLAARRETAAQAAPHTRSGGAPPAADSR